jgi:GT2 family glycosyltransferase
MDTIPEPRVAAVVISYNPGSDLVENVRTVLQQLTKVIIVDNGSSSLLLLDALWM